MTSSPDWDHYRALLAVIDTGSLSAAARRLNLTQPTVGRQIEALERALGLPLFTRSAQGLTPTAQALAMAPHARTMAASAEALQRAASGASQEDRGVVRVTASEVMGVEVLPPILTRFCRAHPRIALELSVSNEVQDLVRRDADIAVRMARPTQGALLARKVGAVRIAFFAHRDYIARAGLPQTPAEIPGHVLIGLDRQPLPASALEGLDFPIRPELFTLRCDQDIAQLAFIRAGLGIGACQVHLAARDPDLVRVLPDLFVFDLETWVVMHEDLRGDRRFKALFDALVEGLEAYIRGA